MTRGEKALIAVIAVTCVFGVGAIFAAIVGADRAEIEAQQARRAQWMASCEAHRPYYECDHLWRTGRPVR